MLDATYPPPLDLLLTLGDPRAIDAAPARPSFNPNYVEFVRTPDPFRYPFWPNYQARYGIGPEHIADLIRMVTDETLAWAGQDTSEVWAALHAYRALGQLRATEAIDPLISLFDPLEDDDWFNEEIPDVFGLIGPAAIPALAAFLADPAHELYSRTTASNALERIGRLHPEARDAAVAALTHQLEQFAENDESLTAFIITDLIDLHATESLPVVERAFAADRVDLSIMGDWEEAEIAFGVKEKRDTPRPRFNSLGLELEKVLTERMGPDPFLDEWTPGGGGITHHRNADKKAKNKKKMADKSRRQNRRKK